MLDVVKTRGRIGHFLQTLLSLGGMKFMQEKGIVVVPLNQLYISYVFPYEKKGGKRHPHPRREASTAGVRASVCSGTLSTLRAVSRRNYVRNRSLAFTCVLLEHGLKSVKNILQLKPTHETCKIQLVHVEGIECRV